MHINTNIGCLKFKHLEKKEITIFIFIFYKKMLILQQKCTFLMNDKHMLLKHSLTIQLKILIYLNNYKIFLYCSLKTE